MSENQPFKLFSGPRRFLLFFSIEIVHKLKTGAMVRHRKEPKMINKSASKIGTVKFTNGNKVALFIGSNRNTGETIVWQVLNGGRSTRVTGKNITRLANDLNDALNEGEGSWEGTTNDAALNILKSYL